MQAGSCLSALKTLDKAEHIQLPVAQVRPNQSNARVLPEPVSRPTQVPDHLDAIKGLQLDRVATSDDLVLWNTLIHYEHPIGVTKFAGHQKKYLISSDHGYLGAIGFSASALYLAARDQWIGWSGAQRQAHLSNVMGLSRFLIRPCVHCTNLASHVLAKSLKRMKEDMMQDHGIPIWVVETFVDSENDDPALRYTGTCFVAAGFHDVGQTTGRGRHAKTRDRTRTLKRVFLYEFNSRWRKQLGLAPVDLYPTLEIGTGLDAQSWAHQEFGGAPLGDVRRMASLIKMVTYLSRIPGDPIYANLSMDKAAIRAYYRLLDPPDPTAIRPEDLVAPHRQRTIERMRGQDRVLCLIDETKINYSRLASCDGLDTIGRNQTSSEAQGVRLHASVPVTEKGLPLGVIRCGFEPSDPESEHPDRLRWQDAVDDAIACAENLHRSTKMVVIIDREGDSASLMKRCIDSNQVDILVRAKHDRVLSKNLKLFGMLRGLESVGTMDVPISKLSRRVKSGRVLHEGREARMATMSLRFKSVDLPCGSMTAIHVREEDRKSDALEWFLLTSLEVEGFNDAKTIVKYYLQRWRIEDFFRVLKGGCNVEDFRLRSARKLHRAIAIHSVIAWRLLLLTLMGRDVPDAPVDLMFTDLQLRVLHNLASEHKLQPPTDLALAIVLVARLGGYQPSNKRPDPGVEVMWRGYRRLEVATTSVELELKHQGGQNSSE